MGCQSVSNLQLCGLKRCEIKYFAQDHNVLPVMKGKPQFFNYMCNYLISQAHAFTYNSEYHYIYLYIALYALRCLLVLLYVCTLVSEKLHTGVERLFFIFLRVENISKFSAINL